MEVVITGDVVNSRDVNAEIWIEALKKELNNFGKEHKDWEIYRGDSFQLLIHPSKAFFALFNIKAVIKQIAPLDVRMALGLGKVDFRAERVLESSGSAFIHSGECFEQLKKQKLMIKSDYADLDETLNLMFALAGLVMDYWKPVSAKIIKYKLDYPNFTQRQLADILNKKSQASISEGLKRGGYDEIENLINYFEKRIQKL